MKILCLQLARFGDIYQTWPCLNALKRTQSKDEIHILVRERFVAATQGLDSVSKVITLPNVEILEPLMRDMPNAASAVQKLTLFIELLKKEKYDRIINLSFSPSSSFIVDLIADANTQISGYTRHADGFLNIPDDPSAYFYAQVGTDRTNRIHLTDLFALIAGVELSTVDFRAPNTRSLLLTQHALSEKSYFVVHVGASTKDKMCKSESWAEIIEALNNKYSGTLVFVGTKAESEYIPIVHTDLSFKLLDLTGSTTLLEIFELLSKAQILVGGDSSILHMASLTQTPTLNISFSSVRFWETGPRAVQSRIVSSLTPAVLDAKKVANEIIHLIRFEEPEAPIVLKKENIGVLYEVQSDETRTSDPEEFSWQLIEALYMDKTFPFSHSKSIRHGFRRLLELSHLGLEQIEAISKSKNSDIAFGILNEIDLLLNQISNLVPDLGPIVRWFQTEKLRIPPGSLDIVIQATKDKYDKLRTICELYELNQTFSENLSREELSWKL
ncbi:MAG: glycosyltransferase family 9 protein [Bdellovibrionales bacterium]